MRVKPICRQRPAESSLVRCSANQQSERGNEDVPLNQHNIMLEKPGNTVLNPTGKTLPISAKTFRNIIIVGDEQSKRAKEDVTFNQQPEETMTGCQDPTNTLPISATVPRGITAPKLTKRSSSIISRLRKHGSLSLNLSPEGVHLYNSGMPLQRVLHRLGIGNAFTHWGNGCTMPVTLEFKGGELSLSKRSQKARLL